MKSLYFIVLFLSVLSLEASAFYDQELQLNSAQSVENITIVDNKFSYTFNKPPNCSSLIRVYLPELANIENVQVKLPNGTVVTSANNDTYNIAIQSFTPSSMTDVLISPAKSLIISTQEDHSGSIEITGDLTGTIPPELTVENQYVGSFMNFASSSTPDFLVHPNEDVTFSQWIFEDGVAPQNTALVTLKVSQSNVVLSTETMLDDGLLNDYEASDGVYTKTLSFPLVGKYTVTINTVIIDKNGATHKNVSSEVVEIRPHANFSLSNEFTEELIDTNNNGYADVFKVVMTPSVIPQGDERYQLQVTIGSDTESHYDQQRFFVDANTTEIILEFDGRKIRQRHLSGPIKFTKIRMVKTVGIQLLEEITEFGYTVSDYLPEQFERDNEVIEQLEPIVTFVDFDNNNIFEGINFAFDVDVLTDGDYEAKGTLFDSQSKELTASVDLPLTAGLHTLNIFINAQEIIKNNLNGPANFELFRFNRYDNFDWQMVERRRFGATPSFVCWDFGDCTETGSNILPLAVDDSYQAIEGFSKIELSLLLNDSDSDSDNIVIESSTSPANGLVTTDQDNNMFYKPNTGFSGLDNFTYTINDFYPPNGIAKGGESTATVQVSVRSNALSNIVGDIYTVTIEQSTILDVLSNDFDADGDTLFFTNIDQPVNGQAEIIDNKVTYTPNAGFTGADNFTYYVKEKDEATGLFGTTTYGAGVVINVIPPNQSPIAVSDTASLYINEQLDISVLTNDSDPDGDSITVSTVNSPTFGTVVKLNDTQVQYTAPAQAVSDSFTYEITDGKGGTAQATVDIEVTVPNYPPIANDDNELIQQDDSTVINVLANDSDPNNDTLIVTSAVSATSPAKGDILIEDNKVKFIAYPNQFGTQVITYTASDPFSLTDDAQLSIRINKAPQPSTDSFTVVSGQTASFNVLLNDVDSDGDILSISSVTPSSNASVLIENDVVKYTPNVGFIGNDSFEYSVDDGFGGVATGTVNVFVNKAPVAVDDNYDFAFNSSQSLDVISNDYDDNIGDTIQVVSVSSATYGSTTMENGRVKYTPLFNYIGLEQFTYTIEDSYGQQSSATVSLTIYEEAPEAVSELFVKPNDSMNVISWVPAERALSYRLYYGESLGEVGSQSQYVDVNDAFYLHKELQNGTRYFYAVEPRGLSLSAPLSSVEESMPGAMDWEASQRLYEYGEYHGDDIYNEIESAWAQNTNGLIIAMFERKNTQMVAKRYHPKKGWGRDHVIFTHQDDGFYTSLLAVDVAESGYGIVIAKESSYLDPTKKVIASIYNPKTDTWSEPEVVVDYSMSSTANAYHLRAAISNNGNAVIGWQGPSYNGSGSIKIYSPDIGWSASQTVDSSSSLQVEGVELAINDSGSVAVSLAYDNRSRPSDPALEIVTIIEGVKRSQGLTTVRKSSLYISDSAASVPYIDAYNNVRVITPNLKEHYYEQQTDMWTSLDITPSIVSSLNRFSVKFGESIEKVAVTYDESGSTLPKIVISESLGSWGMPITVPIQSGKKVLANSSEQVVVEGLANDQNYSMRGNLLTYDKNNLTWSNVSIYNVSTYLGHASDLMLADGYGGVTTLVGGYASRYIAKDTSRNSAPTTNVYQLAVEENGDAVIEAADFIDIDGDILTWSWEYLTGPYISFLSPNDATSDIWIGSTNGDAVSSVKLIVSDQAGHQSTSVITLNVKEAIAGSDNIAPTTTASVNNWGGKTKYKDITLLADESPVLTYWKYSGEDLFNGGNYAKDTWYIYDSEVSFKLTGAGGRMYYYSVDRSGNIETEQSVKIGGKGK